MRLIPLELREGEAPTLQRRVKACVRLTEQATRHKLRIRGWRDS